MKKIIFFSMFLIALISMTAVCADDNITVEETHDLAWEIENANVSETLTLTGDYDVADSVKINKNITIDGAGHNITSENTYSVFTINNSSVNLMNVNFIDVKSSKSTIEIVNSTVTLTNCTFINNVASGIYTEGGAISAVNSTLTVKKSKFINNSADVGSAIFTYSTNLRIQNSKFINNTARYYGGAVYSDSNIRIISCEFISNSAGYKGGAIHSSKNKKAGQLNMDNSKLFDNHAKYGGAIFSSNMGFVRVNNSRFVNNTALCGAVISSSSSNKYVNLSNSDCFNNCAKNGTVIYSYAGKDISVVNCSLSDNAGEFGTIIYEVEGRFGGAVNLYGNSIINSTLTNNSDNIIYSYFGNVTVKDNVINQTAGICKILNGDVIVQNNTGEINVLDFNLTCENITETEDVEIDEGCSSAIIQINETSSAFTFRRDSSRSVCLFILDDGEIRQQKSDGTYFFHVIITYDGWIVGNGGLDSPYLNEKIEAIAKMMFENRTITEDCLGLILMTKKDDDYGHFIIKSPDGIYGAVNYYNGTEALKIGKLNPGEYIVSPNNYQFYEKGNVSLLNFTDYVYASRYLAARDPYSHIRTTEVTYYFVKEQLENMVSTYVDVFISNDDGSIAGKPNSTHLTNDVLINGRYIFGEDIPTIMDSLYLTTFAINHTIKTSISANNVNAVYNAGKYLTITLKDKSANPLKNKDIYIVLNNKTIIKTTNSKGQVKISINLAPGTYKAKITFNGDDIYLKSQKTSKIVLKKATPKMTAKAMTFKKAAKTKKYTVTLKNNKNKVIKNARVTLKVRGKTYSAKTNSKGQVTFRITNLSKVGKCTAVVRYGGNKYYNVKMLKPKFTVR